MKNERLRSLANCNVPEILSVHISKQITSIIKNSP